MLGASKNLLLSNNGGGGPANKTTLRKLPDNVRMVEVENMPSDISDDEWGEVQKFGQRLH